VLALHRPQEQQQQPQQLQQALSMQFNQTAFSSSSSSTRSHGLQERSTLPVLLLLQGRQHHLQAALQAAPAAAAVACRLQERSLQETRPAFMQSLQEGRLNSCW
jgi:hypothetical protein